MKRVIGYVLSGLGLAGLVASGMDSVNKIVLDKFSFMPYKENLLLIVSAILIIVGLYFVYNFGKVNMNGKEVPIYKGKEIVGYRRH